MRRLVGHALALMIGSLAFCALGSESRITVEGTEFRFNGKPFPYTGLSFFNAIYNPAFNRDSAERQAWLHKFQKYGVNVLRVWCQWDNKRGFADAGPASTLYTPAGALRKEPLDRLKAILRDANETGMVIELVLFAQESWREEVRLAGSPASNAVSALTLELRGFGNVTFQIWNEHHDAQVIPLVQLIKRLDNKRLVTSSPGYAGDLGPDDLNRALDYLTPHTSRQGSGPTWIKAPKELVSLKQRFAKPVVDDEPARCGTSQFGGPKEGTFPADHILHMYEVQRAGCYPTYHHDMFQTGYGSPAVPPSGIPDPEFSAYHRQVFEFLAQRRRYLPGS